MAMTEDPNPKMPTERQLEHLEATGKITDEEALALRSSDPGAREGVMRGVRLRHAKARLESAVAEGSVSEEEAGELLRQVAGGGHSQGLRSRIN